MMLASFHNHTSSDTTDPIPYSDKELIDRASKQGFRILAITCHNKFIFSEELREYAKKKGILLIPGTEQSIQMRHVVILNAKPEAEKIHTFQALRTYKKSNPDCFIIAAHPYFPGPNMFNDLIKKNIDCFDAIEFSWWYSKFLNFNKHAKKLKLPLIGTSDTHFIKFHGITHCEIETSELTPEAIFDALRKNKFRNITRPISIWLMMIMPFIALRDKTWLLMQTLIRLTKQK